MLINPPAFCSEILWELGISDSQIKWILLINNSSSCSAGLFQKIVESKIEVNN